jgi:hypothetical protein
MNRTLLIVTVALLLKSASFCSVINVPADQPTIQAGIDAAKNGDTVLVAPGTYKENINFNGKAITVRSSNGAQATIIDGQGLTSAVMFSSNETSTSVLGGFTIQNGNANNNPEGEGGGIAVESASPTIKENIIQNNLGSNGGGGIGLGFASPLIERNTIRNNSQSPEVSGGIGGGGISVRGASTAQIIGNVIEYNTWPTSAGGGLSLFAAGSVLVENNLFLGNTSSGEGTAITMANDASGTVIAQNVFTGNNSTNGSTIFWWDSPAALVNNTITDGQTSTPGFGIVSAEGLSSSFVIANNLIVASNPATVAFDCVSGGIPNPANFYNNDVFNNQGAAYSELCGDQTGSNGNISADPLFVAKKNFRLNAGSPAINAGSISAPHLPSKDFANKPRIVDGTIDMGAYESQ